MIPVITFVMQTVIYVDVKVGESVLGELVCVCVCVRVCVRACVCVCMHVSKYVEVGSFSS